ncbi:short-chain dehydrogenase/reductase SDR [Irpex rosettiformis]|uniref:Short-chain dehydrogenase/reductase SDR n=1 Tax=Irpex rosettiformis TaxID=378272 RepID=A0ACB8TVM0_9APHY|nr:short-chain dehydrogenase/reductase SDR [Irpex rosettiformis]
MASTSPVFIVAGIGNGSGRLIPRLFAKHGYRVALIARHADQAKKLADEINKAGGEAAGFGSNDYAYKSIIAVWDEIKAFKWPSSQQTAPIRAALWNASNGGFGSFLDVTEESLQQSIEANVTGAFAFSRQAILTFRENDVDERGKRGTLLFTGATASIRGNVFTSAFAAGKFGLRSLSQSLSKEFGKENIHVAHAIIDGGILTDRGRERHTGDARKEYEENNDIRLDPDSIASSYLYLANQDRSAWTWELDLRPAHEKW